MGQSVDFGKRQQALYQGYLPIYLHSLRMDDVLDFDLYAYNGSDMVLFLAARLPLTAATLESLVEYEVRQLYISVENRARYQDYLRTHIADILSNETIDEFTKASIVYDSAREVIRDVFANPTKAEAIRESQEFVASTVMFVLEGQNAFHNMVRVMSFDYSLYTHSVNVCTFALALAHASGIERTQELIELGTGALLHDIGKVRIPESILHKPGPLNDSEWHTIRQHPTWGVELISETDLIPQASYFPSQQHHERNNGSGYPDHLSASDIHIYGKIVAIADAFDAMTTNRVYRPANDSFSTLQIMFDQQVEFDRDLLKMFTRMLGPTSLGDT